MRVRNWNYRVDRLLHNKIELSIEKSKKININYNENIAGGCLLSAYRSEIKICLVLRFLINSTITQNAFSRV